MLSEAGRPFTTDAAAQDQHLFGSICTAEMSNTVRRRRNGPPSDLLRSHTSSFLYARAPGAWHARAPFENIALLPFLTETISPRERLIFPVEGVRRKAKEGVDNGHLEKLGLAGETGV